MPTDKIILLVINILGGIAVIGSYILGISSKGNAAALWGGTPEYIRPIYTTSMIIAALGYFAFIYYLLFKTNVNLTVFNLIFIGILLPSALWMPLTNLYISSPSPLIWFSIRAVLAVVGISSCFLIYVLLNSGPKSISYYLAVVGSAYFAFHTAFLDMILWPILFKK